jgi:S-formylglutathione hydrolase FrmB
VTRTAACLACLVLAGAAARAEIRDGSFSSAALGGEVAYLVDLPDGYGDGRLYPVVYALHGLFESHDFWVRRGLSDALARLRGAGEVPELVVVSVAARNSFFLDSPLGAFETLLTRDLIGHVEERYDVIPGREGRALLGVSMGGYAALRIALRRPDVARAAAAHSAMLLQEIPSQARGAGEWHMRAFERVFGNPIDPAAWSEGDPLRWAQQAGPETPALYFDCGERDRYGLFRGNRQLHETLTARGVPHEFALLPGDHGYDYVLSVLPRSLRFLGARLGGAKRPPR